MSEQIQQLVKDLAEARDMVVKRMRKVDNLNKSLMQVPQYQWLLEATDELGDARAKEQQADAELRDAVMADHATTGDKHYPGAEVKFFIAYKYNPDDALNYCLDHYIPEALKLDRKAFDKIAAALTPAFVVVEQEPRVYIDKDLSAFLGDQS